jgi:sugar-specific transcriptional regulator TrmB
MTSTFGEIFSKVGLTAEQAQIYESLLEHGPQSASELATSTPVKRTYAYSVCADLVKKGLIAQELRGRTTVFRALSPQQLITEAQTQKLKAELAQKELENILPTLKSKYNLAENKPVVTYFEGVEGIKKVYQDTLSEKQPIDALVQTSEVHPEIYRWVTQEYVKARIAAGIAVRAIVASGEKTEKYTELDKKELRETKVVDSTSFPFKHEINIYGTKLAIINHNKTAQLIGIIIDNPHIATTFRSWFDLTWGLIE